VADDVLPLDLQVIREPNDVFHRDQGEQNSKSYHGNLTGRRDHGTEDCAC
jgi:hypothetical protein